MAPLAFAFTPVSVITGTDMSSHQGQATKFVIQLAPGMQKVMLPNTDG